MAMNFNQGQIEENHTVHRTVVLLLNAELSRKHRHRFNHMKLNWRDVEIASALCVCTKWPLRLLRYHISIEYIFTDSNKARITLIDAPAFQKSTA